MISMALAYLTVIGASCTDFSFHKIDWPCWSGYSNAEWHVRCHFFILTGTGVGYSPFQAARRAVAQLHKRRKEVAYAHSAAVV